MEHRIDIDRNAAEPTRLSNMQLAALRAAPSRDAAAAASGRSSSADVDTWTRSSTSPAPAVPQYDERVMRARLAAATRSQVQDPAQRGLELLDSAVAASHELHRIIAELDELVGAGSSAANADVHRMRIQAQQMLNALRFQHSISIDGSTMGDVLRGDLDAGTAPADAAA